MKKLMIAIMLFLPLACGHGEIKRERMPDNVPYNYDTDDYAARKVMARFQDKGV